MVGSDDSAVASTRVAEMLRASHFARLLVSIIKNITGQPLGLVIIHAQSLIFPVTLQKQSRILTACNS